MIIVSGAGGRLGGLVADSLAAMGVGGCVTLATRNPEKLAGRISQGFSLRQADFSKPDSLPEAFAGAEALLLISATGPTDQRIPFHRAAFDAAREAAVGRIVYTSRVNPVEDSLYPYAPIHAFSEAYLKGLGVPWTIVRNNEYAENLAPAIDAAFAGKPIMVPGATGAIPWIAVADIAEVIANLLVQSGHEGRTYELNGARAFTRSDIAELVAPLMEQPLDVGATRADYVEYIRSRGMPDYVVEMVDGMYRATDAGEFAAVSTDAERLLGRTPRALETILPDLVRGAKDRLRVR